MLEEITNERKMQGIIKALRRLTPTEGTAAAIKTATTQDNAKTLKTKLNIN